jgi:hypothetical protein
MGQEGSVERRISILDQLRGSKILHFQMLIIDRGDVDDNQMLHKLSKKRILACSCEMGICSDLRAQSLAGQLRARLCRQQTVAKPSIPISYHAALIHNASVVT